MHRLKPLKENNNMERIVLATGNKGKYVNLNGPFLI